MSENENKPSVCQSCGEGFICGATSRACWCMNVKLTDEIRSDLQMKFKDCLCQNCLEAALSESNSE